MDGAGESEWVGQGRVSGWGRGVRAGGCGRGE